MKMVADISICCENAFYIYVLVTLVKRLFILFNSSMRSYGLVDVFFLKYLSLSIKRGPIKICLTDQWRPIKISPVVCTC